uniref:hypothetical protein n=1 Tax=Burkholderia sp. Ac-20379 TaxID=2703900 RepID=UPI00197F1086
MAGVVARDLEMLNGEKREDERPGWQGRRVSDRERRNGKQKQGGEDRNERERGEGEGEGGVVEVSFFFF